MHKLTSVNPMVILHITHRRLLTLGNTELLNLIIVNGRSIHSLPLLGINLAAADAQTQDALSLGHIRLSKHTEWTGTLSILPGGRKGNKGPTGMLTLV